MATIFCSKCKTELPEGAVFCHICGSKLVYGAPKCPNCDREIVEKSRYCSFCGKEIKKDNSTAQVTDVAPKKFIYLPENFSEKTKYTYKEGTVIDGKNVGGQEVSISDGRTWIEIQTTKQTLTIE